jgi:cupin 2 domain-containing protein
MSIAVKNIYADPGGESTGERFSPLWENSAIKIERIVSHSHQSPAGFWYEQGEDEWVIVLRGSAALELANGEIVELNEGDYVAIRRHVKHRVAHTSEQTIWLAVHVK